MYKTQELSQKQEITVAPNIILRYKKKPHLQVYKCPYLDCDAIFFNQDDRDRHLITVHHELPPSVMKNIIEIPSGKLFSRRDIALLRFNHTKQALSKYAALAGASFRVARAPRIKQNKPKPMRTNITKVPIVAASIEAQTTSTKQEPAPAPKLGLWQRISKIFKKG